MANRDMLKWQSNVLSHLDDSDSDSDKESALSGSFMVDSVMNDLKKRGYRNNVYRGDDFHLDPVAEATVDEVTASERDFERNARLKQMAKPTNTTQGHSHSQTVPRNYHQQNQMPVANGNHHTSTGIGFNSAYHSRSSHQLDQPQGGERTRYTQSVSGYHGNNASQGSYGRPDSRGGGSYRSSNEQLAGGYPGHFHSGRRGSFEAPPTVSRNQQLVDARAGLPSAAMGASLGALTRLPAPATPTSPPAAQEETGREDFVRQRSRSLGRGANEHGEPSGSYHNRSGSLTRSDGGGGRREPDLHEVVEFLQSRDSSVVAYAASYLQHLAYGDDAMKMRIRDHGAIPILIGLLRHSERKVQLAVLGALRNLSFGRMNDTNKLTIAQDHGLLELIYQLRSSRSAEVRELVTGVLWNLSSCEHLKMNIIKAGLVDVINYVLLRCSSWSPELAANPDVKPNTITWTTELCNATGMLRNVSSAGEEARLSLRSARSLVDALLWIVRGAIGHEECSSKTVENIMCILRNLSYRIENEVDPQEGSEETMDKDWEMQQLREMDEERRLFEKHSNKSKQSTFSLCTKPQTRESLAATLSAREEQLIQQTRGPAHMMMRPKRMAPLYGTPLLWQPDTVSHYICILTDTSNPETQEAACGAIHNLTACVWKWAAYQRKMVRLCDGLPVIVSLTISESDAVTRAAITALRNLSMDLLNKAVIGQLAISKLISRLPFGSRHQGLTDPTVVAVICALIELVSESAENIRYFRQAGGAVLVSRLAKSKQHTMKIVFAANKLCSLICDDREGRQALKKEHWDISMYNKLVREVGNQFDFEPRSTSKEVKGVRRGSKRKSSGRKKDTSKEKSSSENKSPSGRRKSPIQSKKGAPHRSVTDILPPTPGELPPAEPDVGPRYEAVQSHQPRQASVPPTMQYSAISDEEKATVIRSTQDSRRSEPPRHVVEQPLPPQVQQPLPPQEAASLYSAVDMDKKRAERRYAGQPRDRRHPPQQTQQLPFKPAGVGADSWV